MNENHTLTIVALWQYFVAYVHLYENYQHKKLTHENFVTRNILKLQYCLLILVAQVVRFWL